MGWIKGLLNGVWQIARFCAIVIAGGVGHGASALYVFLLTGFLLVGAVLVLIGVNLDDADRWLDRQAGWLTVLGDAALRVVFGLVLMGCAGAVAMGLYQRLPGRRPSPAATEGKRRKRAATRESNGRVGWGAMILALIVGYFAFIGTVGRY